MLHFLALIKEDNQKWACVQIENLFNLEWPLYIEAAVSYDWIMARNFHTEGVILKTYRVGEYHKGLVIISPDLGVLHATAFGAYKGKSKLSGVSEPFTRGDFLLYHDPVKDRYKVTEITPRSYHEELRSDLDRYYTGLFWSELIIKSFGGGSEYSQLFYLLQASLKFLENTHHIERANLQYVWRYLDITGFLPNLTLCAGCGRKINGMDVLYWQNGEFVGQECVLAPELHRLSPAARKYLLHTRRLTPEQTEAIGLSSTEQTGLKKLLYAVIEDVVGFRLNTLQQGVV